MDYFDFTETLKFERKATKLIGDDEIGELQIFLCRFPEFGSVIQNSDGIRKMRWGVSGKGNRGGARVIYYLALRKGQILLLDIYAKNEKNDLSFNELKTLKNIVQEWLDRDV